MLDGFEGRSVKVEQLEIGAKDSYGNVSKSYADPITVEDVLVAPGEASDDIEDGRPDGALVAFTLYIPKEVDIAWRGAIVTLDGNSFDVVGDPKPWPSELVPGNRNLVVKLAKHEG